MNSLPELTAHDFFARAVQFQRAFGELREPDYPPHDWPHYLPLLAAGEQLALACDQTELPELVLVVGPRLSWTGSSAFRIQPDHLRPSASTAHEA